MPGYDEAADARDYALHELESVPEKVGVTVFCQMANAPAKQPHPNGAKTGPVPVWHLVLTMTNPASLIGPKLRAPFVVGVGAPNKLDIRRSIGEGLGGLRELARMQLARAAEAERENPAHS